VLNFNKIFLSNKKVLTQNTDSTASKIFKTILAILAAVTVVGLLAVPALMRNKSQVKLTSNLQKHLLFKDEKAAPAKKPANTLKPRKNK
jgi:hypothetical protein